MTSKYHTATFTESLILQELGMGDELVTKIKGLYSETTASQKIKTGCPFINYFVVASKNMIGINYSGKAIKLEKILNDVHAFVPSFTISELTLVRVLKEYSEYYLKDEYFPKEFIYKTWGFKTGVFRRHGASVSPSEVIAEKFKVMKRKLKPKLPTEVYKRIKDCVLLNDNEHTIKEIKTLFFDMPYIVFLEEKRGKFFLREFGEI